MDDLREQLNHEKVHHYKFCVMIVCVCVCMCVCVCVCVCVMIVYVFVCACVVFVYATNHMWSWFQEHANQLSTNCGDLEQQLQRLQSVVDKISLYEQQLEGAHKEMSQFKQQTDERISQMETDHQNELEVHCRCLNRIFYGVIGALACI